MSVRPCVCVCSSLLALGCWMSAKKSAPYLPRKEDPKHLGEASENAPLGLVNMPAGAVFFLAL